MEMVQSNKQVVSVSEQTVRARKDPLFRTTVGAEMHDCKTRSGVCAGDGSNYRTSFRKYFRYESTWVKWW